MNFLNENGLDISYYDAFIIGIIIFYILTLSKKSGVTYILIINVILLINLIGNLFIERDLLSVSNINFFIFIISLNVTYNLFIKYRLGMNSFNRSLLTNEISISLIKKMYWISVACILYFYAIVGIIVFKDDLLIAREILNYGNGLFSRVILHICPLLSGILLIKKPKNYLIYPILSLMFVLASGYRGFTIWLIIYFLLIINHIKMIKLLNFKLLMIIFISLLSLTYVTSLYYNYLSFNESFEFLIKRIFIDNVYGYNVLVNEYSLNHTITISNADNLARDLFSYKFSGRLADLGGELTITLPGTSYALGGIVMTSIFGILIGAISGYIVKMNARSKNKTNIAIRIFFLYSFITLINRGYIINYFEIIFLSTVLVFFVVYFLSMKKRTIKYYTGN